jgi:hypothetical protein
MHPLIRCHKREHPAAIPEEACADFDVDELVEHVFTFSLAGLRDRRRRLDEAREEGDIE